MYFHLTYDHPKASQLQSLKQKHFFCLNGSTPPQLPPSPPPTWAEESQGMRIKSKTDSFMCNSLPLSKLPTQGLLFAIL